MEIRCEDKAVLSLESTTAFIFNITKQWKQIQAASPALWQRLPCMHLNTARSATHLHAARFRTVFGTESLP